MTRSHTSTSAGTGPAARAEELRRMLHQANYEYYILDAPTLSDAEFDRLLRELKTLESEHPELVTPDSPTHRIGAEPASNIVKVEHLAPLYSLDNAFTTDELRAWVERNARIASEVRGTDYLAELKIDGAAVSLRYEDGVLVRGATRGNGRIGEDVTHNLRTIHEIPLRLREDAPIPSLLEVRGEVYMTLSGFAELNERREAAGETTYANPRNSAAGAIRQLDPRQTAERPLRFFGFQIQLDPAQAGGHGLRRQSGVLERLAAWGVPVNPERRLCSGIEEVMRFLPVVERLRADLDYGIDGVVVKVDDLRLWPELGVIGEREPRWAIAYKFPADVATTRLLSIEINVGRTGSLNPYAVLEPVEIGGATVQRATLHNFDDIARKDLRVGDVVSVKRAGEVIPQVIGAVLEQRTGKEQPYEPPVQCPSCGTAVVQPDDEVMRYCPNPSCPARIRWSIIHFVSRNAMDIRGLGEQTVVQLVDQGLVSDFADLYALEAAQLLRLEGFASVSAHNLIESIEASKAQPLSRLLFALGVRHVGQSAAQLLAKRFGTMDALLEASEEEVAAVHGVGPTMAQAWTAFVDTPKNRELIERLRTAGLSMTEPVKRSEHATLEGLTFVITGTHAWSRKALTEFIEQHGGRVTGSVSGATDVLVAGDSPGSKLERARELGIQIMDQAGLIALAGESEA